MKHIVLYLKFITVCYIVPLPAQQQKYNLINVTDALLTGSGSLSPFTGSTLAEFRKLTPESHLLTRDFSTFDHYGYYLSESAQLYAGIVLRIADKSRQKLRKAQWRLGFTYSDGTQFYQSMNYSHTWPYDTLTSSQTGEQYILDSIHRKSYNLNRSSTYIQCDISVIFRKEGHSLWSLFYGAGITAGSSNGGTTSIFYSTSNSTAVRTTSSANSSQVQGPATGTSEIETFKNTTDRRISLYVPFGINFRLSKKHNTWKDIHLFQENRLAICYDKISGLKQRISPLLNIGFGVRINMF